MENSQIEINIVYDRDKIYEIARKRLDASKKRISEIEAQKALILDMLSELKENIDYLKKDIEQGLFVEKDVALNVKLEIYNNLRQKLENKVKGLILENKKLEKNIPVLENLIHKIINEITTESHRKEAVLRAERNLMKKEEEALNAMEIAERARERARKARRMELETRKKNEEKQIKKINTLEGLSQEK